MLGNVEKVHQSLRINLCFRLIRGSLESILMCRFFTDNSDYKYMVRKELTQVRGFQHTLLNILHCKFFHAHCFSRPTSIEHFTLTMRKLFFFFTALLVGFKANKKISSLHAIISIYFNFFTKIKQPCLLNMFTPFPNFISFPLNVAQ